MSQMTARFASKCAATGAQIAAGDTIDYDRTTKRATLVKKADGSQPQPAEPHGRYMRGRMRHGSNYARFSSGAEVYQNKRGRCEDAPCCGCCS